MCRLYAVGEQMKEAVMAFNEQPQLANKQAIHFLNKSTLVEHLLREISSDVVILVKGSRSQHLERVVEKITLLEDSKCC